MSPGRMKLQRKLKPVKSYGYLRVVINEKGQFFNCPFLQELIPKDEIMNLIN
jgi:hypothetical protein